MAKTFDLILAGGTIFDGTGKEPYPADLGIRSDRIEAIGQLNASDSEKVLRVDGLALSPGFIDAHAHSDFTLFADPRAEGKIAQGVTTEISGNCGMSAAPLSGPVIERREPDLKELGIRERWKGLDEYFRLLEARGIGLNLGLLTGHGNIRGAVIGYENRPPSPSEMDTMKQLVLETLSQGALGLSSGLIYPPGTYSDTDELAGLCGVLLKERHIYTSHMRSEGDRLNEAVAEVLDIGRRADIRVHVSHIKTAGEGNWHKADSVIEQLDEGRAGGIAISCDCYPYTASSTDLDSLLPAWTYEGGNDEELARIREPNARERIRAGMPRSALEPGYWDRVMISSVDTPRNAWMEGQTVSAIARRFGLDGMDTVLRILDEESLRVGAIFESMSEPNKRKFLSLPYCMIGSDSSSRSFDGPTRRGKPHPRTFGTFPRFLGKYIRQDHLFGLSEAIRRMTSLPALTFGLRGRGILNPGMYADVVAFDPEKIIDRATYQDPFQRPEGISLVIINGSIAFYEGTLTGSLSGRVIRGNA